MHIRLCLKIKYFSRSEPKYSTLFLRFGVGTKFCGVDDVKHFVNYGQFGVTNSLAPDPFFIFLFFFFFFFFFFLRGHNTCIACRIFVYFSPLARKKKKIM